jgi:nucleoside-diphosphate-sugar epimerase
MKVLIVGGAGYVGGALTDKLINTPHEVRVYDNLTYEETYLKDVPFVYGDIRDRENLKAQLDWADAVVWLAALVGDGACAINPELTLEINQESVKWLADNFDGRIIFMSTCSVYGAADGVLTEDSATNPLSVYAVTKLAAEDYLKDKDAIIFRLGTLFGLADYWARIRLDLVVNTLTAKASSEGKLTVFGGDQYRPLLHVRDAAQAIMDNLMTNHTGIYNLHKENMRIVDLAEKVKEQVPCTLEIVETTFEDSRNYQASSKKAADTFNFKPKYDAERGIKELSVLLRTGRIKDLNNPRYSNVGFLEKS